MYLPSGKQCSWKYLQVQAAASTGLVGSSVGDKRVLSELQLQPDALISTLKRAKSAVSDAAVSGTPQDVSAASPAQQHQQR